jgi:hypothetical protein
MKSTDRFLISAFLLIAVQASGVREAPWSPGLRGPTGFPHIQTG